MDTDRNLVFGLLALQMSFVTRDELLDAMQRWAFDKQRPLSELMVEMKLLQPQHRDLLEPLVAAHIQRHGNDPQQSLAAISSVEDVVASLRKLNDAELNAGLRHVSNRRAARASDSGQSAGDMAGTIINPRGDASGDAHSDSAADGLRYRVLRPHAKGGLGEVFVARDTELNREVALKEIQSQFAGEQDNRSRFRQEAEITGNLEHPGIVPVYGLGQYADGRPFYAMRFIRGDSLKEAIERFHHRSERSRHAPRDEPNAAHAPSADNGSPNTTPSPASARHAERDGYDAERTVEFRKLLGRFIDVCNATEYAHSRGVLHRDLKPGNIVLGKYGETLVVDWGLAKAMGSTEHAEVSQAPVQPSSGSGAAPTMMGSAIGTPAYMSPEQAAGRLDELGPATDVYSLGATLYHVLTGKPPFTGRDLGDILCRVQAGDFPRPREIASNQPARASVRLDDAVHKPGASARRLMIPLPLEAICLHAMSLRPSDRYASPLALAEDIERWLADEPVSVYREPLPVRVRRFVRRHQVAVTSLAAAVVVALVGLGVLSAVVSGSNQRLNSANATITAQNEQLRQTNEQLTTANTTIRDQNSAITGKNEKLQTTNEQLAAARTEAVQQREAVFETVQQSISLGLLQRNDKRFAEAELLFRSAADLLERLKRIPGTRPYLTVTLGGVYVRLARISLQQNRPTDALLTTDKAIQLLGEDPADVSRAGLRNAYLMDSYWARAEAMEQTKRFPEAIQEWSIAIECDPQHKYPILRYNNANAYRLSGDYKKMSSLALAIRGRTEVTSSELYNVSCLYSLASESVCKEERIDASERAELVNEFAALACGCLNQAYEQGYFSGTQVVLHMKSDTDLSAIRTQPEYQCLLTHLEQSTTWQLAEPGLRKLVNDQKQKSGADSTQYAEALIALGVNLVAQRKDAEGTETLAAAGEILKRDEKAGPESAAYSSLLVQWGQALLDTQQFEPAETKLRECLTLRQQLAPDDWSTFNAQTLLGASLAGQQKFADAEPLLLSAYAGLKAAESTKKLPAAAKSRPTEALQRLIDLYTAWEKPDQAAEWKQKLAELTPAKVNEK